MTPAAAMHSLGHLVLFVLAALVPSCLAYLELDDDALRGITSGGNEAWDVKSGSLLSPILIPRVPGTPGSSKTQDHFVAFFRDNLPGWTLEWQNSTSKTPATGDRDVPFSNLIFRRDPPWVTNAGDVSRLTLVAHYDTMYQPEGFIGAIDSAVPCAVLLQAAKNVEDALVKKWDAMRESGDAGLADEVGVQILFLDGEEAWVKWSDTDSLYGARALAEAWESSPNAAMSAFENPLSSISLFVLLDLLGSKDPRVPSYFAATHWAYQNMAKAEHRLRKLGVLETDPKRPFLHDAEKARNQFRRGFIQDDHVPFMARGVDVLHVIPTPFPPQWHNMDDDEEHLDMPTVRDWARIVAAFVAEWMEIGEHMPKKSEEALKKEAAASIHEAEL